MTTRRQATRYSLTALAVVAAAAFSGCAMMKSDTPSNMVAFTTQLRGANEVPVVASVVFDS